MVIPFDHLYDTHRASNNELHSVIHNEQNNHESKHSLRNGHHRHLLASLPHFHHLSSHHHSPLSILSNNNLYQQLSSSSSSSSLSPDVFSHYHNTDSDGLHHYRPLNSSKIDCQLLMQHQYLPTLSLIVSGQYSSPNFQFPPSSPLSLPLHQ